MTNKRSWNSEHAVQGWALSAGMVSCDVQHGLCMFCHLHASCMAFLRMTMSGGCASRRLEIWPVVISCTISLSLFCVTVHHLTHWHCGWSSAIRSVMISSMHCNITTCELIQLKKKCLTMAFILLIAYFKPLIPTNLCVIGLCYHILLGTGQNSLEILLSESSATMWMSRLH